MPWERLLAVATSLVAPVTLATALLFYFGYVSTRAQYAYFGVDVDVLGLGTRDYVMRGPQGLLVPALLLLLLGAAGAATVGAARSGLLGPRALRAACASGAGLVLVGVVLVAGFATLGGWVGYALLTPLVLAVGAGLVAITGRELGMPLSVVCLLVLFVVVATFWATATLAEWTGRGIAHRTAQHLDELPAVIVDTREPLFPGDPVTEQEVLDGIGDSDGFRYRYRGLRLLVQAGDRMFLVPERWDPSDSTYVFDMDDVRVKYRFVNDPP